MRSGHWRLRLDDPPRRPGMLTLGLLGLGRIGRRTAELARGMFGAVAAHDAYPREQAANVLAWQRTGRPLTPVREL